MITVNKQVMQEAEFHRGWCACLDAIRASLQEYPHGGGDIGVMTEVDRIVKEALDGNTAQPREQSRQIQESQKALAGEGPQGPGAKAEDR